MRLRPDNASILYTLVRRQGLHNTKVVVMNGPLSAAPGAVPMAAADEGENYDAAKARSDTGTAYGDETAELGKLGKARFARAVAYRLSVGSDEAKILRARSLAAQPRPQIRHRALTKGSRLLIWINKRLLRMT